jgi:DNA polymerase-3 subunit epsilon
MTRSGKLIFIDLEMTGANATIDRITEIGIVEVDGSKVTRWSTLLNPQISIPPFIQNLTGINNEMVADAPTFASIATQLHERLSGGLFIAHNARFDYGFLRNEFKQAGISFRADVLCTVKLSRALFPEELKHNLDALMVRHQLTASARHRALADADLLWQFWEKMQQEIEPSIFDAAITQLLQRPSMPIFLAADALDDIPDRPGVYLFFGENDLPLYIGKSIHLRQRILSHFNADHRLHKEMRLSQQIHRLEWHETAGEIGALLLEAQLIKQRQPIHNQKLRRQRELCSWQLRAHADGHLQPVLVLARDQDFGQEKRLYGLYSTRRKAEQALRELAETQQLCLVTLGIEARSHAGKPCFAYQLRRCEGCCIGHEAPASHDARLEAAFAAMHVHSWPHPGAIGLIEQNSEGRQDVHVVNNWSCLGTVQSEEDVWQLLKQVPKRPAFDLDTYKILQRYVMRGLVEIRPLPDPALSGA